MALFLFVLTLLSAANAIPVANYPVNAQLPPVARVSKPFEFVFSENTFSNGGSTITYSLSKAPSWLQLDSSSRKLYGTPGPEDAGSTQFDLVGSDDTGSANMGVTLVISEEQGPEPGKPLLPQLAKVGPTSSPSTIFLYPGRPFRIPFEKEIFDNTDFSTIYYATSTNNSPLPSWIGFDPSTLSFSGSTPSSGPLTFTFNIAASDIPGFSGAIVSFQIVISQHILAFEDSEQTLNFTRGQPFSTPHFLDSLTIDGQRPASSDLTSIEVDSPDWLTLDNSTLSLSGTAPEDAGNENITLSVTDIYQDVASLVISLKVSQLFSEGVVSCNATIGEDFSYTINKSLLSDDSVQLDVDLGAVASWVDYDSATRTLHGHVPADLKPQTLSVKLIASQGSIKETRNLDINISSQGSDNNDQNSSGSGGGVHRKKAWVIAVAVVVPVVAILVSAVILFLCRRRRRTAAALKQGQEPKEGRQVSPPPKIPEFSCQPVEDDAEGEKSETCQSSISSRLPRLELSPFWAIDSLRKRREQTSNIADEENQLSKPMVEWESGQTTSSQPNEEKQIEDAVREAKRLSQNSLRRSATNYSRKREPLKPIQPKSFKRDSAASSRSKRHSKRSSGIPSGASGLPVRLSGAGHGAGGFGPPGHGVVRVSWQNTQDSVKSDESNIENIAPLFPRPPAQSKTQEKSKRVSLRTVNPSSSETDSLEAFVHDRAKSRNSDNPLFSGKLNARASSSLRALERARRTPSGAETASISAYTDDFRQFSQTTRRVSTAMSESVYTDDNRNSTQTRPLSQSSTAEPFNRPRRRGSQPNYAKKYSEMIGQLPRFWSQGTLASARRFESGPSLTGSSEYHDVVDERRDSRSRSRSLTQAGSQDGSSPENRPSERPWRLGENEERRPVSIADSSSLRRVMGSLRGDLAFV